MLKYLKKWVCKHCLKKKEELGGLGGNRDQFPEVGPF